MTSPEDIQKYISWFDEIDLIDCEEDSWGFNDPEKKSMMDQDDMLSTQANTGGGFEYVAHPANLNPSAAHFSYAGEVVPNYTSSESVIATPMNTDSNVITNTYRYTPSFLTTPTNYYDSNTLPSQHSQKLDSNVQYEQSANNGNFDTTGISSNQPMDTYIPVSNSQITSNPIHYESVVKENHDDFLKQSVNTTVNDEFIQLSSSNGNSFKNNVCVNTSQQNAPNSVSLEVPYGTNNYTESPSDVTCYTDASQEIKMETIVETVGSDSVSDSGLNENSNSVSETDTAVCVSTNSIPAEVNSQKIKEEKEIEIIDIRNENNNESESENHIQKTRNENETRSLTNGNIMTETKNVQMCIRSGCFNIAINNPEWEQEFCSNDCVIIHCRNVFNAWVRANEIAN